MQSSSIPVLACVINTSENHAIAVIGRSNQAVFVLDNHQRGARVAKTIEHRNQSASVVGVQADRRFVQSIERVDEARAQSLGHHHPVNSPLETLLRHALRTSFHGERHKSQFRSRFLRIICARNSCVC